METQEKHEEAEEPEQPQEQLEAACSVVCFRLKCPTSFGERILLVGNHMALGAWNPSRSRAELTTDARNYPWWTCAREFPSSTCLEFKFVVMNKRIARWESQIENRRLHISASAMEYETKFNSDDISQKVVVGVHASARAHLAPSPSSSSRSMPSPVPYPGAALPDRDAQEDDLEKYKYPNLQSFWNKRAESVHDKVCDFIGAQVARESPRQNPGADMAMCNHDVSTSASHGSDDDPHTSSEQSQPGTPEQRHIGRGEDAPGMPSLSLDDLAVECAGHDDREDEWLPLGCEIADDRCAAEDPPAEVTALESARHKYQEALRAHGIDSGEALCAAEELAVEMDEAGGDAEEVRDILRAVYLGFAQKHGEDNVETLRAANNLAVCLDNLGSTEEALRLYRLAAEGRCTQLGDNHPLTLDSLYNLACFWYRNGVVTESERILQSVLAGCKHTFGPEHQSSIDCKDLLDEVQQLCSMDCGEACDDDSDDEGDERAPHASGDDVDSDIEGLHDEVLEPCAGNGGANGDLADVRGSAADGSAADAHGQAAQQRASTGGGEPPSGTPEDCSRDSAIDGDLADLHDKMQHLCTGIGCKELFDEGQEQCTDEIDTDGDPTDLHGKVQELCTGLGCREFLDEVHGQCAGDAANDSSLDSLHGRAQHQNIDDAGIDGDLEDLHDKVQHLCSGMGYIELLEDVHDEHTGDDPDGDLADLQDIWPNSMHS